jgi:DNA-binding PadR family transcriptional regulator
MRNTPLLTKLEDQILMTVWRFQGNGYGVNIYQHLEKVLDSKISVGVVYLTLDRLAKRGFLQTYKGEPTAVRGGMRKKYFKITQKGIDALSKSKEAHDRIWNEYSDLATE